MTQQICREFERPDEDEDDGDQPRFERVMNLMQAMQMLGAPPQDISGAAEMMPGQLPGPDQCKMS